MKTVPAVTRPTIAVLQSILYGVFFLRFAYFLNTLNYIIILFSIKNQKKYHKEKGYKKVPTFSTVKELIKR
jgi:hypothetical protein